MSKLKTLLQITTGLILGAGACLTMPAANAKTVPGNTCTTRDTADVLPYGTVMRALWGDGQVLCGFQKLKNTGSLSDAWARVETPANGTTDCWLYAKDSLDNSQSSRTATTSTAGKASLDFNASLLTTYNYGYYYVACNIDQGGEMIGVRFEEIN